MHSDTDAIPDVVENDRTPGSIGETYEFNPQDPDTYNMQVAIHPNYQYYGDNEVLARVEGLTNPRATSPGDDWSREGKQWRK